ncbi:unnamed protein product [Enterobius vermicularis]|uniref:Calponin-homology (CH) domain-containing protein n=1 Tax=Enterobius vermicularis TaxID=51028 RepID=A0A0N4VQ75_ENTVE|nr:unnamed protein product [Enterobius vermicularis]
MAAGWRRFANRSPYPEITSSADHSSVVYGPKSDRRYRIEWIQGRRNAIEEQQTIEWVAETVGEKAPKDMNEVMEWLQNGIVICRLFEELYPGELIGRINENKSQFHANENITNFLKSAEKSGFLSVDLFELSDLQAKKNISRVLQTLTAIKKRVSCRFFRKPIFLLSLRTFNLSRINFQSLSVSYALSLSLV